MSDLKSFLNIHLKAVGFTAGKDVGGRILDKVIGSGAASRFFAAEAVAAAASALPEESFTGDMMRHAAAGCLAHAGANIVETVMNDSGLLSDIIHVLDPGMAMKDATELYNAEKAAGSAFNHSDFADPAHVDPKDLKDTGTNSATVAGIAGPPADQQQASDAGTPEFAEGFPKRTKQLPNGGKWYCPMCNKQFKKNQISVYKPSDAEVLDEQTRLWAGSDLCGNCRTVLNGANQKALSARRKESEKDEKEKAADEAQLKAIAEKKDKADAEFQQLIEQEDASKKSIDMAEGMLEAARKQGAPEPLIKGFEKNIEDLKLSHSNIQQQLLDVSAIIEGLEQPLLDASNAAAAGGSPNAKNISDKLPA